MGRITSNVVANYVARFWSMALGLVLTPLYVTWLGLEAYGLVGLFGSIQVVLAWLDVGISPTLARNLARLSSRAEPEARQESRDLVATFGVLSTGIGLAAGLALVAGAPLLSRWVNASSLPPRTVTIAVLCMGLNVALQWPTAILNGGLMALERQVLANLVTLVSSGARAALSVALLLLCARRIELFLLGQAIGAGLGSALAAVLLLRALPSSPRRGRFRKDLLFAHWRFAAGILGTAITTTLATQVDTVVLTRVLSLRDFGVYSLAKLISNSLSNLTGALVSAFWPRYCRLADDRHQQELIGFYHLTSQAMVVATMALCLTTSLFAHELVFLWTGNRLTTLDVVPPLRLLAVAAAVQGLLVLPFQVQMAYGWTSLSIKTSLTVLALTAPVTILASVHYGAMGAAAASISFNVVYAARYIPKMHRRILVGELRPWFVHDVMFPVAGALAAVFVARTLWPHDTGRWLNAPVLIAAGSFVLVCSALAGANLRQYLRGRLARLRTSLSS